MKTIAIIAAGGHGARLGLASGKQLLQVAGRPLAAWAVQGVARATGVDEVVVACDPERIAQYEEQLRAAHTTDKPLRFVAGGATRTASVAAALAQVPDDTEMILIHDGARPLVTPELVDAAIGALRTADATVAGVIVGYPVSDTLKALQPKAAGEASRTLRESSGLASGPASGLTSGLTTHAGFDASTGAALPLIVATVAREGLWQVQTPQVFRAPALRRSYARSGDARLQATDDAGLLEDAGYQVALLTGPRDNIKVTVKDDIGLVGTLLRARRRDQD